jgi:hypothetical protein
MKKIFASYQTILLSGLILIFLVTPGWSQAVREIKVGNIYYRTDEVIRDDELIYPQEWRRFMGYADDSERDTDRLINLNTYGLMVGQRLTWQDPGGSTYQVQVAQMMQDKGTDFADALVPVSGAFKRVWKYPYPAKMIQGNDWTDVQAVGDPVDPNLPSYVMIYNKSQVWPNYNGGIQMERWMYGFANREYDDFVIQEFVFTNTSSTTRNDVYFTMGAGIGKHGYYPYDVWGNYTGVTYDKYVTNDPSYDPSTGDSLRIWMAWDADQDVTAVDERGYPHNIWGDIEEPQAFGHLCIHADKSTTDESDDPRQPHKAGWATRNLYPPSTEATHDELYEFISAPWWTGEGDGAYAQVVDGNRNPDPNGYYRVLIPGTHQKDHSPYVEEDKTSLFSFGPYQMNPGEDVRIVMAIVAGVSSDAVAPIDRVFQNARRMSIDVGAAYDNLSGSRRPRIPLPYDVVDLFGNVVPGLTAGSNEISEDVKNSFIEISQQYCRRNASRAVRLWQNGNVSKGSGSFGINLAPASPSVNHKSVPGKIELTWDAVSGAQSYNIYRLYKRKPALVSPTDSTYLYYTNTTATSYDDENVVVGEDYYYIVTAVDANGLESSLFLNRTGTSSDLLQEALIPTRAPSLDWKEAVTVVPNPFHIQASNKYGGRRLSFFNLPPYAKIHIYTMTGDRVQTIDHFDGSGNADWERQDTFTTMEVVSGVYLYVVEEYDGPDGSATGEKAIGKFVVVK